MSHVSQVAHESPGTQRGQPDDAGLIAEAAQALGVPAGTLSSRVARARRKLRAGLGGVNPADESEEQGHG